MTLRILAPCKTLQLCVWNERLTCAWLAGGVLRCVAAVGGRMGAFFCPRKATEGTQRQEHVKPFSPFSFLVLPKKKKQGCSAFRFGGRVPAVLRVRFDQVVICAARLAL